jgi:predicted RNA-binding protein with RPS1 domain/signal transduction histidine kinase/DNA-binding response OmpR family regulator
MTSQDFEQAAETYLRWSHATARVTKVRDFGIFVELDGGVEGIIRRRELTWDGDAAPQDIASPGQRIEVMVIDVDYENRRLVLSRRLVEHDPWQDFVRSFRAGQVVHGHVLRVMPYGAFVEISPGIVGLVHIAEIAPWFVEQVEDVLWVGDEVGAEILSIDTSKRHVALSMKKYLKRLERETTRATIAEYVSREPGMQVSLGEQLGLSANQLKRQVLGEPDTTQHARSLGRILIVDDEEDLAELVESWVYGMGYEVETAYTGEAGLERALRSDFDLILLDLNLPGIDGLEAARRIRAERPSSRIVLMTGASLADEYRQEIETAKFLTVLLKPFTSQEIESLFERLQTGDDLSADDDIMHTKNLAAEVDFFQRVSRAVEGRGTLAQVLTQGLQELLTATRATTGAVFEMDPVTRGVSLVAHYGEDLAFERFKHRLSESPVKDVIQDRELVWDNDVKGKAAARFRYLSPLLDFRSCIGVPVKAQEGVRHGLFLFHPNANHFSPFHVQRALSASLMMGATIERRVMERVMRSFQRLLLVGQLSSGLAHEVNNKLASVEFHSQNLLRGFERLEQEHGDLAGTFLFRDLNRAAETIADMNRGVLQTARMFQTLITGEEPRLVRINEIVERTLRLLDPLARKNQVALKSELAEDLPRTLVVGVRLQQALHNVVLNAIQQKAFKRNGEGRIEVTTAYVPDDAAYPIKIYVADDGPGIHRQHFDQVFALGFTTRREEGTGLGLFITQGLIESMGGRISIAESVILAGTTFLIELPMISKEASDD